jgi:hypothetical protein
MRSDQQYSNHTIHYVWLRWYVYSHGEKQSRIQTGRRRTGVRGTANVLFPASIFNQAAITSILCALSVFSPSQAHTLSKYRNTAVFLADGHHETILALHKHAPAMRDWRDKSQHTALHRAVSILVRLNG